MRAAPHLEKFSHKFAKWAGSSTGLIAAVGSIVIWFACGAYDHFTMAWENAFALYICIITFLMVFLIQRNQNKELTALHIKLNELINATQQADNHLMVVEDLTETELFEVQKVHKKIAAEPTESEN